MKAQNRFTSTALTNAGGGGSKALTFNDEIKGSYLQGLIRASVRDADAAARLSGALISIVNASEQLQKCTPASIVSAALRGEGMGLVLGREYYVVPYNDTATFILGYKGLLRLLLETGEVADTNCFEVREGEYLGRDRRTKRPMFDFSVYENDDAALEHPIIGFYCYVELMSGYFRSEYMTVGEILEHARTYSKSFDQTVYLKLQEGGYSPEEAEKLRKKSPWYSATDTMMKKVVIRKLLNSGYVPLANAVRVMNAVTDDAAAEREFAQQIGTGAFPAPIEATGSVAEDRSGAGAAEAGEDAAAGTGEAQNAGGANGADGADGQEARRTQGAERSETGKAAETARRNAERESAAQSSFFS